MKGEKMFPCHQPYLPEPSWGANKIILPELSEHEQLMDLQKSFLEKHDHRPLELWITGYGSTYYMGMAVCDLIHWHGQVTGVLFGGAMSATAAIWASCQNRVVMPNAFLGVHGVQQSAREGAVYTTKGYERENAVNHQMDEHLATLFAGACQPHYVYQTAGYWLNILREAEQHMEMLDEEMLVDVLGMGRRYNGSL